MNRVYVPTCDAKAALMGTSYQDQAPRLGDAVCGFGRDEGMSVPVELRDRSDRRRCRRAVVGVEQQPPLEQGAGSPEQSITDAPQGTAIGVTARS